MPNVSYIIKYNTETKEIVSLSDAGGTYLPEGPIEGQEHLAVIHKHTPITSNYPLWVKTHYVKDGGFAERPLKPGEYYLWDPVSESWYPDYTLLFVELRKKRNAILTDTDWTQVADAPLTEAQKEEARVYRQALRDLPEQENNQPLDPPFPEFIDLSTVPWPTPPAFLSSEI